MHNDVAKKRGIPQIKAIVNDEGWNGRFDWREGSIYDGNWRNTSSKTKAPYPSAQLLLFDEKFRQRYAFYDDGMWSDKDLKYVKANDKNLYKSLNTYFWWKILNNEQTRTCLFTKIDCAAELKVYTYIYIYIHYSLYM